MGFTDIEVVESHGEKVVVAKKETVQTDSLVANKKQLQAQVAVLQTQIDELNILIKAIDDSPIVVTPVDPIV